MSTKTKLDLKSVGKLSTHPVLEGLPDHLKESSCYAEIEKRISSVMYSDHSHKTVKGFVRCQRCLKKMQKRQDLMKEYGFKSYAQYVEWRKIMSIIIAQQDIQLS